MAHDVFISYSSDDKPTADAACATLENKGIRCWMAPRDILPGTDWGGAIVEPINASRVMVLVYSATANDSPQIKREVERAVNRGLSIIPFRIQDVPMSKTLESFHKHAALAGRAHPSCPGSSQPTCGHDENDTLTCVSQRRPRCRGLDDDERDEQQEGGHDQPGGNRIVIARHRHGNPSQSE
jgi:hypothetical protein